MMSFEKFTVKMKETVDEILGAEYYSELKRMSKNNGTVLTGLTAGKRIAWFSQLYIWNLIIRHI